MIGPVFNQERRRKISKNDELGSACIASRTAHDFLDPTAFNSSIRLNGRGRPGATADRSCAIQRFSEAPYTIPIGIAFAVSVSGITCLHKHRTPPSPTFNFSRDKAEKCPTHSRLGLADFLTSSGYKTWS